MRKLIISLLLAAGGAIGLAGSTAAQAYDSSRIFVDLGDVTFSYGRPYWRHNHEPLYVVYERGYPRYYRVAAGYGYGYAPPPPAHYYRDRDWRYDRRWERDRRWDRRWDNDWRRDGRRYPRHRDRYWD
jgi:hypothetical protein